MLLPTVAALLIMAGLPSPVVARPSPVTVAYTVETAGGPTVHTEVLPDAAAAETRITELSRRADVSAAEIDVALRSLTDPSPPAGTEPPLPEPTLPDEVPTWLQAIPAYVGNDTHRDAQWGLARLSAGEVWASADACGQVIAVIDSGVDGDHPDLQGVLLPGADLIRADSNGQYDPSGHGTHVAGILAAATGNGRGISGFGIGARVLPVAVEDALGFMSASRVAEGILWAVEHGATVINLSIGGDVEAEVLEVSLAEAVRQGVVVVAAAGNAFQNGNPMIWPGASPHTIGVAATTTDDEHAEYSSTGAWVELAAPGDDILSTTLRNRGVYSYESGTSMAVPLVSATAAMLRARDPSLTPSQIREVLTSTAADLGPDGWDEQFGHGLVDPVAALAQVDGERTPCFEDIAGRAHEQAIHSIVYAGITAGCSPASFCPGAPVTRGQMATFLVRALGLPTARGGDYFIDDDGDAHEDSINRVAFGQIATGCDLSGRYCPSQPITRGQMASFLSRALRLPASDADHFSDDDGSVHEWHINGLAAAGLTSGCAAEQAERFCPEAPVTRGQMASFLQRVLTSADSTR